MRVCYYCVRETPVMCVSAHLCVFVVMIINSIYNAPFIGTNLKALVGQVVWSVCASDCVSCVRLLLCYYWVCVCVCYHVACTYVGATCAVMINGGNVP